MCTQTTALTEKLAADCKNVIFASVEAEEAEVTRLLLLSFHLSSLLHTNTDRQTDRQTERKTHTQRDLHIYIYMPKLVIHFTSLLSNTTQTQT